MTSDARTRQANDPLRAAARDAPDRPAAATPSVTWSYAELDARADRLARRLVGAGVDPGDRVACLLPTGLDAVVALHGVPRAGATVAPLHAGWTEPELDDWVRRVRPRAVLCDRATEPRAAALLGASGLLVRLDHGGDAGPGGGPTDGADPGRDAAALGLETLPEADVLPDPDPDADHTLLSTSGTTGRPRGVRLSLANHLACQRAAARRLELGPEDRWLASLAPAHVGGVALVIRAAVTRAALVLRPSFDPEAFLALAEEGEITHASLVPTMLRRVLEARGSRPAPGALRGLLLGGDAADPELVSRALDRGFPVCPTYGLTEAASQVATATPELARRAPDSVGPPLDGVEVRIVDGEIRVRGPTVALGYLGEARAPGAVRRGGRWIPRQGEPPPDRQTDAEGDGTRLVDADGWLHTGDAGRLDDEGHLHVTGRLSRRIVTGGVTVDPAEVERVLRGHPEVGDVLVVGVPDPEWGERVAAAVERDPDSPEADPDAPLDRARLAEWFGERLASPKRPRLVRFVDRLPRNASGKPDPDAVRRMFD